MASTYPAFTVYLSPSYTPTALNDEEAEDLLEASMKTGELPPIVASSRHGWIGVSVLNSAKALGLQHLGFLYGEPWNQPRGRVAYLLHGEALAQVVHDISVFFDKAAVSPEECSDWTELEPEEIVTALASPTPSETPNADYDDFPILFLAYLRTIAQYCEYAIEHGGSLLHVQWDGG